MKTLPYQKPREAGFTLAEMMVAVGVLGLLGLVFFQVLQSGLTLSAKNTAVNAAHEEARQGVLRLTRDIHASISVPQLRDISFAVVSGTPSPSATPGSAPPTAAGVSFQNIAAGPGYVWKDPNNASLIMIKDVGSKPTPGMRLIVPFFGLEEDITKVTAAGTANHSNVFISSSQTTPNINAPTYSGSVYAITYYTDRTMYLVQNGNYVADAAGDYVLSGGVYVPYTNQAGQRYHYENGELHLYKQRYNGSAVYWQDTAIVARYISSPQPFSVPLNRAGGSDNKYVKVHLSARDPKSTNRGYIATASLLETQIDYRSRLTMYQ